MKRIISVVLAATLLLAVLAGCSSPKLTIGGTPEFIGHVGEVDIPTGEYLAHLYSTFYDYYYSQGLYQYAQYYDVWAQEFPYGEDGEKLAFDEYLHRTTQDAIIRLEAVRQLMVEKNITWDTEEETAVDEDLGTMGENEYLSLGISNENFINAYKASTLSESSLFYGLYDEGGERAVSEEERRAYFEENFLSFKIITMELTDSNGAELNADSQKEITDKLTAYRTTYEKNGNFELVVDAYNKSNAAEGEEIQASTDADNRVDLDATQAADEELVKAVRSVDVGKAEVVTYKANGSDLTAALILRLDINQPETLFAEQTDAILYGMKFEEFNEEIENKIATLSVKFKKSALKKCDPRDFIIQ